MTWEGERLKSLAKKTGLSLTKLANLLSVSRQSINDWIRGQVPRGTNLMELCRVLDISPSYFFSDEASSQISVPLHRKRGVAKVTEPMKQEAFELAKQYEKLLKRAPDPGLVPVLRVDTTSEKSAVTLANKLRELSKIEGHRPMDYYHTFKLLTSLKIVTIFRYFQENIKGYGFYSKIHEHRVVFINNDTNVLDLIFPLLHETIHGISDDENKAFNESMESFCDSVASHVQFPEEYVHLVYNTIKGRRTGRMINLLKDFSSDNSHSMFGIVKELQKIDSSMDLEVGGANTNLKKGFYTIGEILFDDGDPRSYINRLAGLAPLFIDIVVDQIDNVTTRKVGEWVGLESSIDAKQAIEELRKTPCTTDV